MPRKDDWDSAAWLNDKELGLCTSATRGVWSDLVNVMRLSGCTGELSGTYEQLARLARCSAAEMTHAITDLRTTGAADVLERNGIITVMNRRMSREHKTRQLAAARQLKKRRKGASRESNDDVHDDSGNMQRDGAYLLVNSNLESSDPLREKDSKKKPMRARFIPPTIEEVRAYCAEKKYDIDAEHFVAFYEANGWVQGKQNKPIRSWQMCLVTWSKNALRGTFNGNRPSNRTGAGQQHTAGVELGPV